MLLRIAGLDALNRAAMAGARPLRDLRRAGLLALHGIAPVRRAAMRLGLGVRPGGATGWTSPQVPACVQIANH